MREKQREQREQHHHHHHHPRSSPQRRTDGEDGDEEDQEGEKKEENDEAGTGSIGTGGGGEESDGENDDGICAVTLTKNTKSGIEDIARLVSKAHALVCEVRFLSRVVPEEWKNTITTTTTTIKNNKSKYKSILFDFKYLETPRRLNIRRTSATSRRLDLEFRRKYEKLLERYYLAFNAVTRWYKEFIKFTENVEVGLYGSRDYGDAFEQSDGNSFYRKLWRCLGKFCCP